MKFGPGVEILLGFFIRILTMEFHSINTTLKSRIGPLRPNSIIDWVPSDSKELFLNNLQNPEKRKRLEKLGWTENSIKYQGNDFGFRMDDFTNIIDDECIVYLGCSITFGVGLNLEDTWGWKHWRKHYQDKNFRYVNLSWPGSGADTFYRMLKSWSDILKIKKVYTLGSYFGRREIISHTSKSTESRGSDRTDYLIFGNWVINQPSKRYDNESKLLYCYLSDNEELKVSYARSWDAICGICMRKDIPLFILDKKHESEIKSNFDCSARDLIHNGPNWHTKLADLPESAWERLA